MFRDAQGQKVVRCRKSSDASTASQSGVSDDKLTLEPLLEYGAALHLGVLVDKVCLVSV